MTDKPNGGKDIRRSSLDRLYPAPKSYEQRKADSEEREEMFRRRLPRHPHLTMAAFGSCVYTAAAWYMQSLNTWWFAGQDNRAIVMTLVFFSFLAGLVVAVLLFAWVKYVNNLLYRLQGNATPFWIIYGAMVAAVLTFWLSGPPERYTSIVWIAIPTAVHFVAVAVLMRRIISH